MIISSLIGDFGKYHAWICFLIFIAKFSTGLHHMAFIFLAPPVAYNCSTPNETCCENPEYDQTIFHKTIVTEWNLICDRSWLRGLCQTLFQLGVILGSLLFGIISDRYGRRPALLISVLTQTFVSLLVAFMSNYWAFIIVRMILGISQGGILVVGFVLVMEFIGLKYRDIVSTLFHVPFVTGHIILTVCAYYVREFDYLLLIISLPNVLLLSFICWLPESPLWLLATNQTYKAIALLERVAKINKKPNTDISHKIENHQFSIRNDSRRRGNISDIFFYANLRNNLLIMSFIWLVSGFCYYGGTHYISYMTGDIFLNQAASGILCLLGCFFVLPLVKYLPRKILVYTFNIVSGFFFLMIPFLNNTSGSIAIGCIGVLFSFMNLIVAYLYCYEMFPTAVRNVALGFSSMMTRVGAMLAPFVVGLRVYGSWYGPLIFGLVPVIAAILCSFLPETKHCDVEEVEIDAFKPIPRRRETRDDIVIEDVT